MRFFYSITFLCLLVLMPFENGFAESKPIITCFDQLRSPEWMMASRIEKQRLYKISLSCLKSCESSQNTKDCDYSRALSLGFGMDSGLLTPSKSLPQFIKFLESSVTSHPEIDNGGPHRVLAELYLRLPVLPILGGNLRKNLPVAAQHIDLAIKQSNSWDNLMLRGEIALEQQNFSLAQSSLKDAKKLIKKEDAISQSLKKHLLSQIKALLHRIQK